MDPISITTSFVSLLSTCLKITERIEAIKDSGGTSRRAVTRFEADKRLLNQWASEVGIENGKLLPAHHRSLDDPQVVALVEDILANIQEACVAVEKSMKGLSSKGPSSRSVGPKPLVRVATDGPSMKDKASSKVAKLKWGLMGQKQITPMLDQLGILVKQLFDVVSVSDLSLKRTLEELEAQRELDGQNSVKDWLKATWTTEIFERSCRRRLDQTCKWIERDGGFFSSWLSSEFPMGLAKILWIHGPAGYGKTILCAKIAEDLSTSQRPVAHFFMSADTKEPRERDMFTIIRSWLHQLVCRSQRACEIASRYCESESVTTPTAGDEDVVKVLGDVLRNVDGCTLIVDGLDECVLPDAYSRTDERDRNLAWGFFDTIAEVAAQTETRILLTSRPETHLQVAFSSRILSNTELSATQYSIQPQDVHDDAAVLSKYVVDNKLSNKSDSQRQQLADKILTKSEGMFLWIKMMEADLRHAAAKNQRKLLEIVEMTPKEIDKVYGRNWQRIKTNPDEEVKERAFSILRWVAFAPHPLTVLELTEALTIPQGQDDTGELDEDDLPDKIDELGVKSGILDICDSLVEIRHQKDCELGNATVHVVHFSVREFLANKIPPVEGLRSADERLNVSNELIQKRYLMFLCFRYLGVKSVWERGLPLGEGEVPRVLKSLAVPFFSVLAEQPDGQQLSPLILNAVNKLLDPESNIWLSLCPHAWGLLRSPRAASGIEHLVDGDQWPSNERGSAMLAANPICFAAWVGLQPLQHLLTEAKAPASKTTKSSWTALHFACMRPGGGDSLVRVLIDKGADVDAQTEESGDTPLLLATYLGRSGLARILLQSGARQIAATKDGFTPLHAAAYRDQFDLAELLMDKGADINAKSTALLTPLHSACQVWSEAVASLLLDRGPDVRARDHNGDVALSYALTRNMDIARRLLNPEWRDQVEVNTPNKRGWTLLHSAVGHQNSGSLVPSENAKTLLGLGANIEAKSEEARCTPLHFSAIHGSLECMKVLLDQGANLEAKPLDGRTATHLSAETGHLNCLKLLIQQDADVVNARDENGWTPVHFSARRGHLDCLKFLIQQGADVVNARDTTGWTPAHFSAGEGHLDCLKFLIQQGADVNTSNTDGWTPAHISVGEGHLDCLKFLIQQGTDGTRLAGGPPLFPTWALCEILARSNHMKWMLSVCGWSGKLLSEIPEDVGMSLANVLRT